MKELKPYTYQVVNNRKENIVCSYKLNNQVISFEVGNYNREQVLVIDPSIVFSSYSRSASDNWGMTATYGPDGSFFGAGIVQSTGFPVTTGAIQSTGGGPTPSNTPPDIGIIKLSADGTTRIFATYLGGTALEQPHSLIADAAGNLIITGRTSSGVSFPGNLFGTGGGYDIFVTKINADGTAIIGSTKIGGSGDDGVNISPLKSAGPQSILRNFGDDARSEVILNANNNILLASCTRSSNFFITGAFQQTFGGSQDAVIIKLNADATNVIWSTYLGGTGDDATFSLAVKNSNNSIYVTGGTTTTFTFPASTFGVQPTNNGGLTEGYLSLLIDFGNSIGLSRSTYLGTSGADIAYAVKLDQLGFPYVTGTTTGMWPIINAVYSVGNARQFIAKLEPNLSAFIYSTTFGVTGATAPNLTPAAFFVDDCENVYVTGWGGGANTFGTPDFPTAGTAGLIVTANALQTQTDGSDFYIFVLEKNAASHKYGSFFGQNGGNGAYDHVEGGTSRFDRDGVLYLAACANCKALTTELPAVSPFPITAGVYGNINPASGGASCNLGMVKIRFDYAGSNCIVTSDNLIRNNSATALYFFPNPNKGKFYLRYTDPSDAGAKHSIRIYDALGAVVYTQQIAVNPLMSQVMIDMSEHSKGVYLVEVIDAKGKRLATGKFLID